jgi:type VI secretion system protein ImpA
VVLLDENACAAILRPIEGDFAPVGADGRSDDGLLGEAFRELRAERRAMVKLEQAAALDEQAQASESQWSWETIAEAASAYLAERSKDLDIFTILVEAVLRLEGLPGLASAMTLLADFVETYWENGLYPREDEDDGVEARFLPLSGLSGSDRDGSLIGPLRRMTLVAGLSLGDKIAADAFFARAQAATSDEQRAPLTDAGNEALDALADRARGVPVPLVKSLLTHLVDAEAGWRRAIGYISERTKPRFPAASLVSGELGAMRAWSTALFQEQLAAADVAQPGAGPDEAADPAGLAPRAPTGAPATREQALAAILAAADYFEKVEPLGPTGPALREVCRRARMTYRDLMAELLPDMGTRNEFYLRSGIRPPEE